jgi:nucleoid-associated protein YgaU
MNRGSVSRRDLLRAAAITGAAGLWPGGAAEARRNRSAGAQAAAGPMLSSEEIGAIDQALGKKGAVVADQVIYTVPLPRADLQVIIKDAPVPTGFDFGGWVAFKKTTDGGTRMGLPARRNSAGELFADGGVFAGLAVAQLMPGAGARVDNGLRECHPGAPWLAGASRTDRTRRRTGDRLHQASERFYFRTLISQWTAMVMWSR